MAVNYAKRYQVTADQIRQLRDEDHLSWAKVADALELGTAGTARRVYTELVRPHRESILPSRQGVVGSKDTTVSFTDDTDPEDITAAVAGNLIVVERSNGNHETLHVKKLTSIGSTRAGKQTVNFKDAEGKNRTVHASAIVAVR